jgi:hypothetical protein
MAQTQTRRASPISPANTWDCTLSASPNPVQGGDDVTFTVQLSNPWITANLGGTGGFIETIPNIPPDEIAAFYDLFDYVYDPGTSQLTIPTSNPAIVPNQQSPVGSYDITVTVTAKDITGGDITTWFTNNESLVSTPQRAGWEGIGQTLRNQTTGGSPPVNTVSLAVVTSIIQTQSQVTLQRTFAGPTDDRALWPAIRNRTAAIGFDRYKTFIDCVFCEPHSGTPFDDIRTQLINKYVADGCLDAADQRQRLSIYGPYAYSVLKLATQVFLTLESGVVIREGKLGKPKIFDIEKERIRVNDFSLTVSKLQTELRADLAPTENLPYLNRIVTNLITIDPQNIHEVLPYCLGVLQYRLTSPSLIELIWSYWLEEGMLVQTMNAIARRFQNRRGSQHDPLGELEFDPLRPLNNLIWGFIQDEHNRLTVPRRAHEYIHHYGLTLMGKAVPDLNPADTRSKFIEGFHNLLSAAARFFRDDSDTTVIADAFPLLNALKDVHLLLAEGAHNQFGDLTWTARAEMMSIQWMLARPEMKEFLRGRYMVPYQEDWMGAVDSMKKLQDWTDTTITHFYELAVTGERILLSIRYGDWSDIENIEDQAKTWARSCKPEIQRYIYGYKTVSGVDLAADIIDSRDAATRYLQPSALLLRRLRDQMSAMRVGGPTAPELVAARVSARVQLPRPERQRLPASRRES